MFSIFKTKKKKIGKERKMGEKDYILSFFY